MDMSTASTKSIEHPISFRSKQKIKLLDEKKKISNEFSARGCRTSVSNFFFSSSIHAMFFKTRYVILRRKSVFLEFFQFPS